MKSIIKYFLQGLLYTVPLAVTIYVIWSVFIMLDGIIPIDIPGLGILFIFLFITAMGVLGSHLLSDRIILVFEGWIKKAPLVNVIYTSVKDLMNAFVGDKKSFSRPVSVKLYEDSQIRRLGFITNDNFKHLGKNNDLITVYIPHSYNISGNMFLVPESYVEPLDVISSDLMKYTMSGGVTSVSNREALETLTDEDDLREPDPKPLV
ncbi:MAG TPA: hypothetical protein DCG19_05040 [Cryomorphaceae bacterium]|nr:hypothetical protein [Owenweeksia sp.]MBF98302.1 hypothetical protein [Owenweeksia sp.]HAD96749.1 hypothetical protein [Cryomorphaceae bacterium]HBF21224.1 hypothetical protein [Cryomorphaceae bacterium]HCQ16204.1 hypothetical protein [Cryomorphaceae bacterium]|tara:strand:- start:881 stop:1498 length:618 start_codon:yes stop_codon:yes gene_type:complete